MRRRRNYLLQVSVSAFVLSSCGSADTITAPRPEPPSLVAPATTCSTPITLSGSKQANTSVWLADAEVIELDAATSFTLAVDLQPGTNVLSFTTHDVTGAPSAPTEVTTQLTNTPPAPPTVQPPPGVVEEPVYVLRGTRAADTGLIVNGIEAISPGPALQWQLPLQLVPGENRFALASSTRCSESDVIDVVVVYDAEGVELGVNELSATSCHAHIDVSGHRGPGVAVYIDDLEVIPASSTSTTWRHTVQLVAGDNTIEVWGVHGERAGAVRSLQVNYQSDSPVGPTVVQPPDVVTEPSTSIGGTKPVSTWLLVDGQERADTFADSEFNLTLSLSEGLNVVEIDVVNSCGRSSGAPTLVAVYRDNQPPLLELGAPEDDVVVSGPFDVEGLAEDDDEVAEVQVFIDDAPVAVTGLDVFSAQVDPAGLSEGEHTIRASAVDRAGNRSATVLRTFSVVAGISVVSVEAGALSPAVARSSRPTVSATVADFVYVVWYDNNPAIGGGGDDDVLGMTIAAGASPVLLSDHPGSGHSRNPRVATEAGDLAHIVFEDDGTADGDILIDEDIYYRRASPSGLSPALLVTSSPSTGRSRFADVAVDQTGVAHVVWQDDGDLDNDGSPDADIYYAFGGLAGFSAPHLVSSGLGDGVSTRPRIAVTPDGFVHIVWQETGLDPDGQSDIYYTRRDPLGLWGATVLISEEAGFMAARSPAIAADPEDPLGLVYVAFDGAGDVLSSGADNDVFMRLVFDNLVGGLTLLSDGAADGTSADASVTVDDWGSVHVAYWDNGDHQGCGTDPDIYLRSFDGALQPITPISHGGTVLNDGTSVLPSLAAGSRTLTVTWQDDSNYDADGVADFDVLRASHAR